jgi:hypothetical protein
MDLLACAGLGETAARRRALITGEMCCPRTRRGNVVVLSLAILALTSAGRAAVPLPAEEVVAPGEPAIAPTIPSADEIDTDGDRVGDALQARVIRFESQKADPATAALTVDETADVELVFSSQIQQPQLDAFLKLGGRVTHVYQNVSYGWNGTLPLSRVREAAQAAGPNLVAIVASKPTHWHLDKAARIGRVRPQLWDSGYDGDASITIAIVDTGADDSHTDLAGRMEYWKDYTTDASSTPVSVVSHGTHVAGIALGTGATSGVNPTTIRWTDQGTFPSSNGSFYPTPHELAPAVTEFDWTTNMIWQTGGNASAQHSQAIVNAGTFGYAVLFSPVASTGSPIAASTTGNPNPRSGYLRLYTSFNSSSSKAGGKAYSTANAVTARVSNFGVGDSYNLFRGVAPGCRWAGGKVFTNSGSGNSTDIGEALDDMVTQRVAHNIKVLNMSLGLLGTGVTEATLRAKANTCVDNGIVVCISMGNDGPNGEISDPGRAAKAITVGATNDINQLTDYTSIWTAAAPGATQDYKPDVLAPGGSLTSRYSMIMSVDSNDGDAEGALADQAANDYQIMAGTSMASPFAAGCAALVIDAWQTAGHAWSFGSSADPLLVKMLLCASATETNQTRESGTYNPTLERAAANALTGTNKDPYEGYGMINPDAAVDALTTPLAGTLTASLGPSPTDRRAVGRHVDLTAGGLLTLDLTGMTGGDYDLYVYDSAPDGKGNPVILASSTNAGMNVSEAVAYTPSVSRRAYVFVKRVSGSGGFRLSPCGEPAVPTDLQANPPTICEGQCATLSATPGDGGDAVEWFTDGCGGAPVPGGAAPSVCPSSTTTYYARTRNSATLCASAACAMVTVVVNARPTPTITAFPGTMVCGGTVTLAAGGGYNGYLWSPGGETTQMIHVTTGGTYDVMVTNGNGCQSTGSITIVVNPGVREDLDHDCDVDLDDFAVFQTCFNGPNRPPSPVCAVNADFEGDGDVDLLDFAIFQMCFNGPNRPPACSP